MKVKKIIMIILLIVIISLIIIFAISLNSKTPEQIQNNTTNTIKTRVNTDNIDAKNTVTKQLNNEETIVLSDKYFITQINEIYYNIEDYKGRKIEIEGFQMSAEKYTFVGRYGPRLL